MHIIESNLFIDGLFFGDFHLWLVGELLLEQDLRQRGKGLRQPVQPAAERLIAGQLWEVAQMICSDEIVDTLPRQ